MVILRKNAKLLQKPIKIGAFLISQSHVFMIAHFLPRSTRVVWRLIFNLNETRDSIWRFYILMKYFYIFNAFYAIMLTIFLRDGRIG